MFESIKLTEGGDALRMEALLQSGASSAAKNLLMESQQPNLNKNEVVYDLKTPKADPSTDAQMAQLHEEVNQMKKLMAQLKKGNAIGEIFTSGSPDKKQKTDEDKLLESIKAQRLEDLKR